MNNKTFDNTKKIAVNTDELMEIVGVGKNTAYKIGEDAGAVIRIGRRKLYNLSKIQAYLDSITEGK
jgi:hypothetical protein